MHLTQKLIPQKLLLDLLEAPDFKRLADELRHVPEGEHTEGMTQFGLQFLSRTVEREHLSHDQIRQYDENIRRHTRKINELRDQPIRWKYYQYLALLFTEVYLDRFYKNPHGLCSELNRKLNEVNESLPADQRLKDPADRHRPPTYSLDDLTKLAFLQATGSGKTLQMHINILQYLHYRRKTGLGQPDRILVLTPNEGLSVQHQKEAEESGFSAELFDKDKDSRQVRLGVALDIIDIYKLDEVSGDKTVAVEAFEGNNLVLVDEGHRGASGVDWMKKRQALCRDGFSFEYSATFTQAVNAASGAKRTELEAIYARCILFDYSYKWFHGDGFGKDYKIRNLDLAAQMELGQDEQRELYLTACLLGFYQQLRLHMERGEELRPWLIEEPLLVFVGSKVTATFNKQEASDIIEALKFLDRFARHREETVERIGRLLGSTPPLTNTQGVDLFHRAFDYLRQCGESPEQHYAAALRLVFNGKASARVHAELLKGSPGEIGLRLGEADYFGVVNVGDATSLNKLLASETDMISGTREFSDSLFRRINDRDSKIKILLGSKKFTEGWSSYRVSTMGLLNVGRSEGTQIIQLFGRGVRLRGYGQSLKRSAYSGLPPQQRPKHIQFLETLNVFGIRADFMAQFRQFLEAEGLPPDPDSTKITMPVLGNLPADRKLKALGLPPGTSFKRQGPRPRLLPTPAPIFRRYPVELNWYPRIQQVGDRRGSEVTSQLYRGKLSAGHTAFLDLDELYLELIDYKQAQRWNTLNIERASIPELLSAGLGDDEWYVLYIPQEDLAFDRLRKRHLWQEIATVLLKKYLDRFYKTEKAEWENGRLVYRDIGPDDVDKTYRFEVDADREMLFRELQELKEAIETGKLSEVESRKARFSGIEAITWNGSLFQPLVFLKESVVRLSSLALRESERQFVCDLVSHVQAKPKALEGKDLYLLRNETKHRGIGFFDAGGFFPDFILWIVDGERQRVCFVDPHGLVHEHPDSPKIGLAKEIKEKHQKRLADPNIVLESFILSQTPFLATGLAGAGWEMSDCVANHVLFMDRPDYIEKMLGQALEGR